jgi:hypothetical protein
MRRRIGRIGCARWKEVARKECDSAAGFTAIWIRRTGMRRRIRDPAEAVNFGAGFGEALDSSFYAAGDGLVELCDVMGSPHSSALYPSGPFRGSVFYGVQQYYLSALKR